MVTREDYLILKTILLSRQYGGVINGDNISYNDLQAYLHSYSQPGALTYPINYYHRILKKPQPLRVSATNKIKVPTLVLFGNSDRFFSEEVKVGYDKYVDKVQVLTIQGSHCCSRTQQRKSIEEYETLLTNFVMEYRVYL